jgi:NAD(P)-dependent dehydrogenase (short-subunit alcohol dehydrogenase family)
MPGTTVYGATKAAVISLAKTMSADLAGRGIRVNAVSPGPVESALLTRGHMSEAELKQTKEWIQNQVLIKRFAKADEIAEAVLYLCSGASSYVVGSELIIDGGMTL